MSDRAYIILNRLAWAVERALDFAMRVLVEVPVVFYDGESANSAIFDRFGRTAFRRSEAQLAGLYPFERRMLERYFPPPPARLLAHGVGGGRELLALVEAGYEVEAYEPAVALATAARSLVRAHAGGSVQVRSAQEWAREARGAFGGVFTGWGMWAHLIQREERLAVLRAFRAVCPEGPVLLSFHRWQEFFSHKEEHGPPGSSQAEPYGRLRRITRHHIRERVLHLTPIEPGTGWHAGYFYHLTEESELRQEATEAGYEMVYWESSFLIYPHAVLLPLRQV